MIKSKQIESLVASKVVTSDDLNFISKQELEKLQAITDKVSIFDTKAVLPTMGDANTLYVVKKDESNSNKVSLYLYLENKYELISTSSSGAGGVETIPPFTKDFAVSDWVEVNGEFVITVSKDEHLQGDSDILFVVVKRGNMNVGTPFTCDVDGTVKIYSGETFDGKLLISNLNTKATGWTDVQDKPNIVTDINGGGNKLSISFEDGSEKEIFFSSGGGLEINGAVDVEAVCGEDLLRGDVVKIVNHDSTFESLNRTDINPNPDVLPSGAGYECSFSSDGNYLAVVNMASPSITIYKRDGDMFTKLSDPDILPSGNGSSCSFSSDGNYLAVGHLSRPFITIYKRDGDVFTKLADPDILPSREVEGCSFSPDGNYLAVAHTASPYITIYKRDGDVFTKLPNLEASAKSDGHSCAFSQDGNYLAVGHLSSPYITIYKRDGDVFTKLANPDKLPSGSVKGCSFSPDGKYLALSHVSTPHISIYKRNGDVFTKLDNPDVLPIGNGYECSFSQDGNYLSVAHGNSPFITIYKRDGDIFTKLSDPDILPSGSGYGCSFSPDGKHLAVAHGSSPFITIYKVTNLGIHVYQQATTDYFNKVEGLGIMNESGQKDESKVVKKILNREQLFFLTKGL